MTKPAHDTAKDMDWLAPVRANTSGLRIKSYSMYVSSMKVVLPAVAVAILFAVMIWSSGSNPPPKQARIDSIDATMRDATFTSREGDKPYEVQAPVARQDPAKPGILDLTNPTTTIDLGGSENLKGEAESALYNQNTGELDVQGDLVMRHSDGTVFTTTGAQIDVNKKTMVGDQPAVLTGAFGEVRGAGIEVKEGGKIVTFTGPSTARLKMGQGNASQADKKPSSINFLTR